MGKEKNDYPQSGEMQTRMNSGCHLTSYCRTRPMYPPKCRNVAANAIAYVDVSGRAHPSGNSNLCPMPLQFLAFVSDKGNLK